MESLDVNNVYCYQKGRILGDDTGGAVKDIVLIGLHNLTEGEKTPLTNYNKAVQHLQCRHGIMSVAEQVKSVSLQLLSQPTATTGPSVTTYTPVETPTLMVTENNSQDYEGMSVDENDEDERPTEIRQILDELADEVEDTTLLRLSEEDVALDMDEVVMEVEEQEELSDDDEDSEESGGLAED